ncbi:3'(2'),5'-bisphosphate nucleotidase CysQ [Pseudidiomarina sediminum]|uniref:3'(2'),5'-bisphosphate nucleotidase CysQ n=1 Tax=Pseudidiomarina sediminum TaxID=431675 RepID=UPI001FD46856|nr:3'(2'),5'-bisphosphate nucleotidase CysQ [Pseudidiomarina sediminum]
MLNLTQMAALEAIAIAAGDAILPIYCTLDAATPQASKNLQFRTKANNTPVTAADALAHNTIVHALAQLPAPLGHYPVISEESAAATWAERKTWQTYWLVDPLDGTKEFLHRNDEFTVNIALIHNHHPIAGVVYAPALKTLYSGSENTGARKNHQPIAVQAPQQPLRIASSRSHPSATLQHFLAGFSVPYCEIPLGSSLKLCWLAEGLVDLYPRLGPTAEWDIAAGQAILEAAGGHVMCLDGTRLSYNRKASFLNPSFIAFGAKLPDAVAINTNW